MNRLTEGVLDILFPPTCLVCQTDGAWVCEACLFAIQLRHEPSCQRCGVAGHEAGSLCKGGWPFASVTILGAYRDPILRTLITQFKYKSARCLSVSFGQLLTRFREEWQGTWPWAAASDGTVVPAPSDPKHVRQRGLDHTLLLAENVRDALIPWAGLEQPLLRQPRRWKNADLKTPELRAANVSGSVKALKPLSGPVFLVDDVVTSGATASETAQALFAAGAGEVHLVTLAAG